MHNELDYKLMDLPASPEEILADYRLACMSRQVSLVGQREVVSGKAKFGIFGAGKEVAQIAMAKVFRKGDFRSGYYRDQTFMFAIGETTVKEFFAQLYAHTDVSADPATGGRAMNAHFATRLLNPDGTWKNLADQYNSASDLSPVGSQLPRLVGLAYASRLYRELPELKGMTQFSHNGDEIAFGTTGNAATAEGMFWETINAIGVLKSPAIISIWDDGYGISVPNEDEITKGDLSEVLKGFQRQPGTQGGYDLYKLRGWDYPALIAAYQKAAETARREHVPAILHIFELTQPQGHSTSGSHERYKPKERLEWEQEFDCNKKFREWILSQGIASAQDLDVIEEEERSHVEDIRESAWNAYINPITLERREVLRLMREIANGSAQASMVNQVIDRLAALPAPIRKDLMVATRDVLLAVHMEDTSARQALIDWKTHLHTRARERYDSYLYSQSAESALKVPEVKPVYTEKSPLLYGFEVINNCFDAAMKNDARVVAFGQDVGRLGDVNQGFRGLQARYGELRVADTGIRECTIIGQAIGLALRGLRPIAEIQYLDYMLYALQIMSDDLATLHWRTHGGQKAPVVVRTRGHRLEGIWHSGSLMAGIVNLARGMYVLVPRDMTQAAGFYNTLLRSDEPAVVVEVLNAYRIREKLPDNIGEFTVALGVPEVIRQGSDITLVTYGACCRVAVEAADLLSKVDIQAEVVDVQSLLPFDLHGRILESIKKTSRVVFIDEDVPGGTTAYMMREVLEKQGGYFWLDSEPRTIPGKPHRPAYGSDGDYWSKPNTEQIFDAVYGIMHEADPVHYPLFF
jgi:pyruvate/2-oxoglutarate/acetoin dehydrogenase E1 component/TPP-dependent pyruvate/acetoin dehydrogenase alpha subunit